MIEWVKYSDSELKWEEKIINDNNCDFRQAYNWGNIYLKLDGKLRDILFLRIKMK